MRTVITTKLAPSPAGPYSQAVRANGFILAAGQVALDPATQELVAGGITEQTEQILRNVAALLGSAGSGMEKVVRCAVYLKSMADAAAMNEVYVRYFRDPLPARTTLEVSRLPKGSLVQIEVTALE